MNRGRQSHRNVPGQCGTLRRRLLGCQILDQSCGDPGGFGNAEPRSNGSHVETAINQFTEGLEPMDRVLERIA